MKYKKGGELLNRYTYVYDDKRNKIEENKYNRDSTLSLRHLYKYDVHGNAVEELRYNSKGILVGKMLIKYDFDKAGNWIKQTELTADNVPFASKERLIEYFL
jgi:hypothetical protein